MTPDLVIAATALLLALFVRPWRLFRASPGIATPLLASLVILPWLWAMPALHTLPLQLQWSGACLVLLMVGWPLAVPVFVLVGIAAWAISPMAAEAALALTVWHGIVPATLALALGGALRRFLPPHPFIYVLGRGFLGTVLCLFAASALEQRLGHALPGINSELNLVALWLMAWGDAFVTGMLCAIFVAFRPQWLLTWSDNLYLHRS